MRSAETLRKYPEMIFSLMRADQIEAEPERAAWEDLKQRETRAFRAAWPVYERKTALNDPVLSGYADYFRQYKKTYPVLLQMESVLLKGREIKALTAAVEAMFLAEVKHGLLVAGHDADRLSGELVLDLARGGEILTVISGQERILKADDVFLSSGGHILSSVLEGQDYQTRLTENSASAIYCVYGFGGVGLKRMKDFFRDLESYLKTAWPRADIKAPEIFTASGEI